jgi:phosphatidylglycerophosphatase A
MPNLDETAVVSASVEEQKLKNQKREPKTFFDYLSLAVTTCGVGYLPLAPGTWGSIVGIFIYIGIVLAEAKSIEIFIQYGWGVTQITAWFWVVNLILFLFLVLFGIRTSGHATKLFGDKDPQKIVVDEVMGQLLVFLFVPLLSSWWLILAGFFFFRLFDITKPYPIDYLQNLPAGIGVCADDLLAGIYGGVCLSILYAISLSF